MDELVKFHPSIYEGDEVVDSARARSLWKKSRRRNLTLARRCSHSISSWQEIWSKHIWSGQEICRQQIQRFFNNFFFSIFGFFWAQGGSREGKSAGGCRQTVRWELWWSWTRSERRKCLRSGRHGCSRRPRHARIMASYLSSLSLAWTQNRSRRYRNCSAPFDCGPTTWRGFPKTGTNSQDSSYSYQSQWASHAPLFVIVLTHSLAKKSAERKTSGLMKEDCGT